MIWGKPVSEGDQGLRKKPVGRSIKRSREGAAASLCSRPWDMQPSCRLAAPPEPLVLVLICVAWWTPATLSAPYPRVFLPLCP